MKLKSHVTFEKNRGAIWDFKGEIFQKMVDRGRGFYL